MQPMTEMDRDALIRALPYARRYARALAGSQSAGDRMVAESLKALLHSGDAADRARLRLYRLITQCHNSRARAFVPGGLTRRQRQLLLLTALEELSIDDACHLVDLSREQAVIELNCGRDSLRTSVAADVLIIEDEPVIAMDLEELVRGCGHRVVGVAATESEAVSLAQRSRPGLILADINLGAGGDGSSAVERIQQSHQAPVIFVTAYPERLLTGSGVEPAFVITKPFEPMTLAIATYQAVTGGMQMP